MRWNRFDFSSVYMSLRRTLALARFLSNEKLPKKKKKRCTNVKDSSFRYVQGYECRDCDYIVAWLDEIQLIRNGALVWVDGHHTSNSNSNPTRHNYELACILFVCASYNHHKGKVNETCKQKVNSPNQGNELSEL